jgi:hypothetical protein
LRFSKEKYKKFLVFRLTSDIVYTDLVEHKINTGDSQPIKQRPYATPLAKREVAEKKLKDMSEMGIIEPSISLWCSLVVMVTKKYGSIRFCYDFKKLDDVTITDCQPLPRINVTLDGLGGIRWFSTLDTKSGYWQCGQEPQDR